MSSLHQIVDPPTALHQPQTDVSGGGLVNVPGLGCHFWEQMNLFFVLLLRPKRLKALLFKICRYLIKEGI